MRSATYRDKRQCFAIYRVPTQNSSSSAWKKNASSASSDKSSIVIPRRRQSTWSVSSAAMTRFLNAVAVGLVVSMYRLTASIDETLGPIARFFRPAASRWIKPDQAGSENAEENPQHSPHNQSPRADDLIAEGIGKILAEFFIGEIFYIDPAQATDKFKRFARSTDEVAGGFGGGFFGIHANTNGADARNFMPASSVR